MKETINLSARNWKAPSVQLQVSNYNFFVTGYQ